MSSPSILLIALCLWLLDGAAFVSLPIKPIMGSLAISLSLEAILLQWAGGEGRHTYPPEARFLWCVTGAGCLVWG